MTDFLGMETEIVGPIVDSPKTPRELIRHMSETDWIEAHGSGTLRKNKRLGMVYRPQYLHERVAWEFGHCFEVLPRSRVTFGDAITEADSKPVTEAGWFIDRYFALNGAIFPTDSYVCKYIFASRTDGTETEGIGIVVKCTSAPWIPTGHILFAIVTQYNKFRKAFEPAINPL